jgi:hypothetical protein
LAILFKQNDAGTEIGFVFGNKQSNEVLTSFFGGTAMHYLEAFGWVFIEKVFEDDFSLGLAIRVFALLNG